MSKTVLVRSGDAVFHIEVDERVEIPQNQGVASKPDTPGVHEKYKGKTNLKGVRREFDEVKAIIAECCNGLFSAFNKIPDASRFTVEFGVKLGGETGVPLITKATGEVNFKVTAEWVRDK